MVPFYQLDVAVAIHWVGFYSPFFIIFESGSVISTFVSTFVLSKGRAHFHAPFFVHLIG